MPSYYHERAKSYTDGCAVRPKRGEVSLLSEQSRVLHREVHARKVASGGKQAAVQDSVREVSGSIVHWNKSSEANEQLISVWGHIFNEMLQ